MTPLNSASILVVGIARDCGNSIRNDIANIQAALAGARRVQWCIIESDSKDKTRDHLLDLAATIPDFAPIFLGDLRHTMEKRTERIATCRNRYLDELPNYPDVDFVFASDLDGICKLLTAEAVESCFTRDDWDVCAANQRAPYFDIWALRSEWSKTDCNAEVYELMNLGFPEDAAREIAIYRKMVRIPETSDWIEVRSAFGGTAIYRREALHGVRYEGLDADDNEQCEHVRLHAQMIDRRFFINPRFINAGWVDHSEQMTLPWRMYRVRIRLRNRGKAVKKAIKDAIVFCGRLILGSYADRIGVVWRKFRPLPPTQEL